MAIGIVTLTLPFIVAVSRTRDYRHHYADVLCGSLIGIAAAWLAFEGCFQRLNGKLMLRNSNMRPLRAAEPEDGTQELRCTVPAAQHSGDSNAA
jgi:hypothetical protein